VFAADTDAWALAFTWDGVRAITHVHNGAITSTSRNRSDLVNRCPELAHLRDALAGRDVVLDGELVALGTGGRPDFGRLQHRVGRNGSPRPPRGESIAIAYLVCDLLYLDGAWLVDAAWDERRDTLEALGLASPHVAVPPAFGEAPGAAVVHAARSQHLEGVVATRRRAPNRPGTRSPGWVKIKRIRTQEVVIGGWSQGGGVLTGRLGALLVGTRDAHGLTYIGKVGTGFDDAARRQIVRVLRPLERPTAPFANHLPAELAGAHVVAPTLVGAVRFTAWTAAGRLRHPSWRGWRLDKRPEEIVREP